MYIFLPLCLILYFVRNNVAWRNGLLVFFSLVFYAWGEPLYIFLMIFTVAVNYVLSLLIRKSDRTGESSRKKLYLIASIAVDLLMLGVFKYTGFICELFINATGIDAKPPQIALPIGISFYTFQIISYMVDVYRGRSPVQKSFVKLLLYVSLFPQLVAGPIIRYEQVAKAIEKRRVSSWQMQAGIQRFIVGLTKKSLLANACGGIAETSFAADSLPQLSVLGAWFGIIMYAFQIYFDFSSYSDMAIGLGRIFGFTYRENFNYPYISKSATEFWRRWHISLGSFFRDYVYIPLGGNRKHQYRNLLFVWALTGLWHGASTNFILWGLWWFVFIAIEKAFLGKVLKVLPSFISHLYSILIFLFGWVLFYFTNLGDAMNVFGRMLGIGASGFSDSGFSVLLMNNIVLFVVSAVACLPVSRAIAYRYKTALRYGGRRADVLFVLRCVLLLAMLFVSTLLLVGNSYNPFIYFRF